MIRNDIIDPVDVVTLWPKDVQFSSAAAGTFTTTNEGQTYDTYDFDQTSSEAVSFGLIASSASRWGATVYWTAASGSGTVAWQMQGAAIANGATLDAADGSAMINTGTFTAAENLHMTELPISEIGSSGQGALLNVDLIRITASDTLNADARMLCVVVRFYR